VGKARASTAGDLQIEVEEAEAGVELPELKKARASNVAPKKLAPRATPKGKVDGGKADGVQGAGSSRPGRKKATPKGKYIELSDSDSEEGGTADVEEEEDGEEASEGGSLGSLGLSAGDDDEVSNSGGGGDEEDGWDMDGLVKGKETAATGGASGGKAAGKAATGAKSKGAKTGTLKRKLEGGAPSPSARKKAALFGGARAAGMNKGAQQKQKQALQADSEEVILLSSGSEGEPLPARQASRRAAAAKKPVSG
jgi:hypothetical protein